MVSMNLVSAAKETRFQGYTDHNFIVKQHPHWSLLVSLLIFLGPWILLLPLFLLQAVFFVILHILGFGVAGITGGMDSSYGSCIFCNQS